MSARVAAFIERLEAHFLLWLRLATVVLIAIILVVGVFMVVVGTANVTQSTEVSVGSVEPPTFAEPEERNMEEDSSEPQPIRYAEVYRDHGDGIDDMVEALLPIIEAAGVDVSAISLRSAMANAVRLLRDFTKQIPPREHFERAIELHNELNEMASTCPSACPWTQRSIPGTQRSMAAAADRERRGALASGESASLGTRNEMLALHKEFEEHLDAMALVVAEGGTEAQVRTEAAVEGLFDYMEDLATYYGDEIDTSGMVAAELAPAFRRHLHDVLKPPRTPLDGYVSAYRALVTAMFGSNKHRRTVLVAGEPRSVTMLLPQFVGESWRSPLEVSVKPIEPPTFADPGVRNPEEGRVRLLSEDVRPYAESFNDMVEALQPIIEAAEMDISNISLLDEAASTIRRLRVIIAEVPNEEPEDVEARMDDAVEGLVDYVEDLADYYGGEIDIDTSGAIAMRGKKLGPAFQRLLADVLRSPLDGYVSAYLEELAATERVAIARAHAGEQAVAAGMAAFMLSGFLGVALVVLLFLLILFNIEIHLRPALVSLGQEEE